MNTLVKSSVIIKQAIKFIMQQRGLSIREVALKSEVNQAKFSSYLSNSKGSEGFSEKAILKVCKFLEIKPYVYVEFKKEDE